MGNHLKYVNLKKNLKKIVLLASVAFVLLLTLGVWAAYLSFKFLQQSTPVVELNTKAKELKGQVSEIGMGLKSASCHQELLHVFRAEDWSVNNLQNKMHSLQIACLGADENKTKKEGINL